VTPPADPLSLIAELSYRCPLHCPYCSNPTSIQGRGAGGELSTEDWTRVMREAGAMGVLQVGLTGGEPLVRRDLEEIVTAAADANLYSTLITAGTMLSERRVRRLAECGLDHVQISIQHAEALPADAIAGSRAHERKLEAARLVRALDLPLTINAVLHRHNLDAVEEIIELAADLEADRLELANAQWYGWAVPNQAALMPSRAQVERAEAVVERARKRLDGAMQILFVLSDLFEDLPKPCVGGWGRTSLVVAPDGEVMPCHAATDIPGLQFDNVRHRPLASIWHDSEAFRRFRGTEWMQEPCRTCPLGRQEIDFGGCRCQAMRLTGDPAATDPVCRFSPAHGMLEQEREQAVDNAAFISRTSSRRVLR